VHKYVCFLGVVSPGSVANAIRSGGVKIRPNSCFVRPTFETPTKIGGGQPGKQQTDVGEMGSGYGSNLSTSLPICGWRKLATPTLPLLHVARIQSKSRATTRLLTCQGSSRFFDASALRIAHAYRVQIPILVREDLAEEAGERWFWGQNIPSEV
jgi:hypothetical protein